MNVQMLFQIPSRLPLFMTNQAIPSPNFIFSKPKEIKQDKNEEIFQFSKKAAFKVFFDRHIFKVAVCKNEKLSYQTSASFIS